MFSKRRLVVVAFVTALAGAMIFPFSHCNQHLSNDYHGFAVTDEFRRMQRSDQILKCASCHKQEYENEMKGPHSHAYQMLLEHKAFVNSDRYICDFYTRQVNGDIEACSGCHTPQNLFETLLRDSLKNRNQLAAELIQLPHLCPLSRTGDASRVTSIDCLNCHFDGSQMVSLKHLATKEDSVPAFQTKEVIAKNNISCFPCHSDVVKTINPEFAIKRTGSVLCINCHQEYNQTGKGTHYYYWNKDPAEKQNTKMFAMMDDFHFKLSSDHKTGEITWINTTIPHPMSPGPEMIFKCEVLDIDSNLLGAKTIRTNKKKEFDEEMYTHLGNNYLYGEQGDEVTFDGTPLKYDIELKNSEKDALFRISLIHKAQYWFPDSLGVLTAVKTYPVAK